MCDEMKKNIMVVVNDMIGRKTQVKIKSISVYVCDVCGHDRFNPKTKCNL